MQIDEWDLPREFRLPAEKTTPPKQIQERGKAIGRDKSGSM
jgi:hypothetical protein